MDIKHELKINASAEKIFSAVATQDGIRGWWSRDNHVGENEGDKSLLKFDKQGTIVEMGFQTKELVKGAKVVWECTENGNPAWIGTRIVTEIAPVDTGCQVTFSHAGFDDKWKGHDAFEMTKGTWNHFVNSLKSFCEKGEGQPW